MTVRPSESAVFAVTVCSLPSRRTTTGKVSPGSVALHGRAHGIRGGRGVTVDA